MAYFQCMNIGSEGASVLEDLTDISLNNLTNGQILKYNTTTQKWENSNESGEIPDVQLFETLTYTEVKISSVVSPFTITNNTLTSVSSSMSNSETNILSTSTFDLTDIDIIEVVVDSATFYQGGNWNGFFYVCDDDTNVRNNTYPSVAHKIMFSNTSTPLKYSLDVSQLNGQWFIGVCTGGHTNLVVSAVAIGSGLTGHVIIDKNNVDMSQRSGLQFTGNVTVTDDSTNDKTVVNIQGTSIDDTTASGSTTYSSNKTNTLLNGKVDKVAGKELSTNDYTNADKAKLEGIAEGAEVNVQSDWNQTDSTQDDYIKNKPSAEEQTATDEFETINGGLLSALKVSLTPNQDLHGYSEPWVGGAGKNKAPLVDKEGYGLTFVADELLGKMTMTGLATGDGWGAGIIVQINLPVGSYICSATNNPNNAQVLINYNPQGVVTSSGVTINVTDATQNIRVAWLIANGTTYNNVIEGLMIRSASEADPTFAPYSNECPISGHTQVDVGDDGINLISGIENGAVDDYGSPSTSAYRCRTVDFTHIEPNTQYTLKALSDDGTLEYLVRTFEDADGSYRISDNDGWHQGAFTFTSQANAHDLKVIFRFSNNASIDASQIYNVQLELGSTATPYEPYNGYQVTVNLGGTYYSGTLDVVTGVFTPDTAEKILPSDGWLAEGEDTGAYTNYSIKADSSYPELICSESVRATNYSDVFNNDHKIGLSTTRVIWHESTFADVTALMNYLSNNTVQIVHKLATPTPIQLSPTMVKALVGENHLSAPLEGQEITESKYRELFTWDEVEEIAQKIATSAVADLRCYQSQDGAYGMLAYVDSGTVFYDWVAASPSVKLLSTISVMPSLDEIEFTDSSIYSNSICELVIVGDSDVPAVTHVKVTSGKVVFTLSEALDNTIQCACKVTNSILY